MSDELAKRLTTTIPAITACILARNEEKNIGDALQSLRGWVEQIIVLDNESTDGTVVVAAQLADLVLPVTSPGTGVNFDALRNVAIEHATGDWIFYLDADERVPPRLGLILQQLVAERGHDFEALLLPFKHYFCGKWMQHCNWWPGYTRPQLLKKGRFQYNERLHSGVEVNGQTIKFPADDPELAIIHYSYANLHHYLEKLNRYTDGEAENLHLEGTNHSWQAQLAHFVHDWQTYYDRGHAYEDGLHGFVLSFLSAFYRFASRAKLWDLRRQRGELVNPGEPLPSSLREALDFMEKVVREGTQTWLRPNPHTAANPLRLLPSTWLSDSQERGYASLPESSAPATSPDLPEEPTTTSTLASSTSPITACIVARNEAEVVEEALQSLTGWTRRILFVDNGSTDGTADIARRYASEIITVPETFGHQEPARYAVRAEIETLAFDEGGEWLLLLDADERIPPPLAAALTRLVAEHSDDFDVLYLPFKHYFCGKWMEHCGHWPGYPAVPRLVKRNCFTFNPHIHNGLSINPGARAYYFPADDPDCAVVHHSVKNLSRYLEKENQYTTREAEHLVAKNWDYGWRTQMAYFALGWQDAYDTNRGDLDGMPGFILSFFKGMSRFFERAKLWDAEKGKRPPLQDPLPTSVLEIIAFIRQVQQDGADWFYEQEYARQPWLPYSYEQAGRSGNARQFLPPSKDHSGAPRVPLLWSAPLLDASGYASEARQFVLGLAESGFPLALAPAVWGDDTSGLTPAIEALIAERRLLETAPTEVFVSHTLPPLVHPSSHARVNVARTMFETDRLPTAWAAHLSQMDRVWVPSAFNRNTFVASGVPADKIAIIPAAIAPQFLEDAPEPMTAVEGAPASSFTLPGDEPFRFLSVFDWTLHKGWDVLIEAFVRAFGDKLEVGLVLKVWSSNGYSPEDIRAQADTHLKHTVGKGLSDLPNVHLWVERLTADQMPHLYRSVQAYVTPTRGEGWCRPLMEAMATGLPCIATNWSGLTAFFGDAVGYPLRYTLAAVSDVGATELPSYRGHQWAEPDVAHLAQLLRHIVRYPAAARRKGLVARTKIATEFSRSAVTEVLRSELQHCLRLAEQRASAERAAQISPATPQPPESSHHGSAVLIQCASGDQTALLNLTEPQHAAYTRKHDMRFVCHKGPVQSERAPTWDKIALLRQLLNSGDFEYLIWLDADTLIIDPETDLRAALPPNAWLGMVRHQAPNSPGGAQWFKAGALYIRNTPESRAFFDEVWRTWPTEHFWEDNMAIIRVLGYDPHRWTAGGGVVVLGNEWNSTRLVNESDKPVVMAWHGSGPTEERLRLMRNVLMARDLLWQARNGVPMPPTAVTQAQAVLVGMGHSRTPEVPREPPLRLPANPLPIDDTNIPSRADYLATGTTLSDRPDTFDLHVRWEGDVSYLSSLSLVNRELCLHLMEGDAAVPEEEGRIQVQIPELEAQSADMRERLVQSDVRLAHLLGTAQGGRDANSRKATVMRKGNAPAEVTVRHFFPPDWRSVSSGKLVVMQPWEYGYLPRDWVEASRHADQIWAYSRFVRDVYVRSGVPAEKVHLVPLGVRTEIFQPAGDVYPLPTTKRCRFLFVGGTIHRKGADLLLEAWRRAFRPSDDVCLVIKDMGTDTYYRGQNLGAAFRALEGDGTVAEVQYLGDPEMDTETLASLYRACTSVVLPYRGEGFALSPLEGMACGLCPIVTAGGPSDDYLDDTMALRVPSYREPAPTDNIGPFACVGNPWTLRSDMESLVGALRWVYEHPEEVAQRGQAAHAHVVKGWTWERSARIARRKLYDLVTTPQVVPAQDAQLFPPTEKKLEVGKRSAKKSAFKSVTPTHEQADAPIVLSLCMIARDEEPRIGKCLESIRPWVDEMIVVDTGSTDRTREIALAAGARVFDFPWTNSFAEARNQSLSQARGEWIFWMDADDVMAPETGPLLRELISQHPGRDAAYQAQVRIPPGPGEFSESLVDHVKLFPNRPNLRFEHRIHEQILPALRRAQIPILFSDLYVTHQHYDRSPEGQAKKRRRDFRLLQLDLRDHPGHPFVLFNLGMTHLFATKDYEVAAQYLERSLAGSHWRDSIVRKAYALLTTARTGQQEWEQAIAANEAGRRHYPEDTELLFQAGQIYQQVGRFGEARIALERLVNTSKSSSTMGSAKSGAGMSSTSDPMGGATSTSDTVDDVHYRSVDVGLRTYRGLFELALLYRRMGDEAHCATALEEIMKTYPRYEPAQQELEATYQMIRSR